MAMCTAARPGKVLRSCLDTLEPTRNSTSELLPPSGKADSNAHWMWETTPPAIAAEKQMNNVLVVSCLRHQVQCCAADPMQVATSRRAWSADEPPFGCTQRLG